MHNIGIVKEFAHCGVFGKEDKVPDFTMIKVPQFWEYDTGNQNE